MRDDLAQAQGAQDHAVPGGRRVHTVALAVFVRPSVRRQAMKGRHRQEMTPSESLRQMAEAFRGAAGVYAAAFAALAAAMRAQKQNDNEASSGDRRRTENEQ